MSTPTIPAAWIAEGAKVICWTEGGSHTLPHYAVGRITKLNAKTFRVVTSTRSATGEPLFRYESYRAGDDTCQVGQGDSRLSSTRYVASLGSPVGRKVYADARDAVAESRAISAVRAWEQARRDRTAIDGAIRQLTALRDQLDSGPATAEDVEAAPAANETTEG